MCIRDSKYDMPQDAMFYINIELMNIVISWLKMCQKQGRYLEIQMKEEIKRVCEIKRGFACSNAVV